MIKPWKVIQSKNLFESRFCDLRVEQCELSDGRIMPAYYILDFSDWVNIVPLTSDGEVLLIKQYRHGSGEITWEVPGGAIHETGDKASLLGGVRELEEETGYSSKKITRLPTQRPNPAVQSNRLHTLVAEDCFKIEGQNLDPFEEIEVEKVSVDRLYEMIDRGEITHSLVLSSLLLARKFLMRGISSPGSGNRPE